MFDSIGWGEIIVLALAALFIFGPERLPHLAKDAAAGLKRAREAITGVRSQVHDQLGEDFDQLRDLDLRKYHPKTFLRSQLLGDDGDSTQGSAVRRGSGTGSAGLGGAGAAAAGVGAAGRVSTARAARPRDRATPPPFDADAT